jgi:hypothetical protein
MNVDNHVQVGTGTRNAAEPAQGDSRGRNVRPWVNWGLALAMLPAAAIVMLFALGAVMSTRWLHRSQLSQPGPRRDQLRRRVLRRARGGLGRHRRIACHRKAPRRDRGSVVRMGAVGR